MNSRLKDTLKTHIGYMLSDMQRKKAGNWEMILMPVHPDEECPILVNYSTNEHKDITMAEAFHI